MKLTQNFYLAEFTASQTAERHGIKNIPSPEIKQNLIKVSEGLEEIRQLLGNLPIQISSGYRNPELNRRIGGARKSHHMQGWAADFTCWSYGKPIDIVKAIKNSGIEYDQLIEEGSWVHISFKPSYRNQTLIADFKNGKATYRYLT